MKIKNLSDLRLLEATYRVAKEEQNASFRFLEHLMEVDDRKLFATLNYDSLAKYVIKQLGYSETTAYERVRAMRLLRRVPEVGEKLAAGELNLTTVAQVESFRYREKLSTSETVALIEEVAHKSKQEVDIHLLSKTDNPIPEERVRQITPELKEAKIVLDEETQALLKEYENIHGKQNIAEILKKCLKKDLAPIAVAFLLPTNLTQPLN